MKASFPPFASCFPPWSCFARPRRLKTAYHGASLVAAKPLCSDFQLLENALTNCCQQLRGGASNHRPRGTLIADRRRACAARPKRKNEESLGRSLLQTKRFKFFPATGTAGSQGHSQLKTSNFFVTYRFFVTFFTEESNVPLFPFSRSLVPLFSIPSSQ